MIRIIYRKRLPCEHVVRVNIGDIELGASRVSGGVYIHKRDAMRRIQQIREACESEGLKYSVEYHYD